MKELKIKSYKEVQDWNKRIDRFNGKGNLIPHEGMVSKNRGNMWSNASTQYRPILDGEVPIVDTCYSYSIQKSTKNMFADTDMVLMKTIKKYINGKYCGVSAHILYSPEKDMFDLVIFRQYEETGAGYGVKMIDDLENLEPNSHIEKGESIIRTNSFSDDMEYKWGVNANTVLAIDIKSIEDAGLISSDLAKKFTGWKYQRIEEILDVNNDVLKNLYGNEEIYKPFPMIGEEIQNDILMAISKNQRNHQFIKTGFGLECANKIDKKIFCEGRVIDITVRQKYGEVCQNTYLSALIEATREYELELFETLKMFMKEGNHFSPDFTDMYYKLKAFYESNAGFKYKKILGNQNIIIEILVINEEVPHEGQKITGRCGNKFTVSEIFPAGKYYTKEFGNIDYLGNCLALFNRAIMEVPMEMFQSYLSIILGKAIKENMYPDDKMKEIILTTLNILDKEMYEAYKEEFDTERGWKEFKKDPMIYWYQSTYHSGTTIKTCYEARNYLKSQGIEIKRTAVYMDTEHGEKYLGDVFVSKLFITPLKQVADTQLSIRAKGSYDTRGIILRTGDGRKRNTPVRKSSLVGDIQANTLHPDDLMYINSMTEQESIQVVNALFAAMGVELRNPMLDKEEDF